MGLFSFLKKKQAAPQPPSPQQFDLNQVPSDIPPIDSSQFPMQPGSSGSFGNAAQSTSGMQSSQFGPVPQYGQPLPPFPPVQGPGSDTTFQIPIGSENMQNLPFSSPEDKMNSPLSLNVPSLDMSSIGDSEISMPKMPQGNFDDAMLAMDAPRVSSTNSNFGSNASSGPNAISNRDMNLNAQVNNEQMSMPSKEPKKTFDPREIEENLNSLFVADELWRQPNWENFDPYTEEKIEEPSVQDFGLSVSDAEIEAPPVPEVPQNYSSPSLSFSSNSPIDYSPPIARQKIASPSYSSSGMEESLPPMPPQKSELPEFDDDFGSEESSGPGVSSGYSTNNFSAQKIRPRQDVADVRTRISKYVPMDLFVKGSDYEAVVHELGEINNMLMIPESGINLTEDTIKKQDPELSKAKENMEFLYKRFMFIDKKIFNM